MNLKVETPSESFAAQDVTKIIAEGENGYFCILPRHIDYVNTLVPGLLSFVKLDGSETFFAVDEGVLVKKGSDVYVAVRNAISATSLGSLKQIVTEKFEAIDEREKKSRAILTKLEMEFLRRYMDMK
jgi:F-type H+-transporting ATPase subunit epsilon